MTTLTVTKRTEASGLVGAQLDIAGAPEPPGTRYASNFSAGLDGWTIVSGSGTLTQSTTVAGALLLDAASGTDQVQAGRTVSGLTVGQSYRYQVAVEANSGYVTAVVTGVLGSGWTTALSTGALVTTLTVDFTATATSHEIKVAIKRRGGTWSTSPSYNFGNALLTGPTSTWKGLRVYRTDANGTSVPVRNPSNEDTTGGDLRLYDWDAALTGTVSYTVKDGADGTATGSIALGGSKTFLQLPMTAWPYFTGTRAPDGVLPFKITSWNATQDTIGRTHQIIGRTNKVGNPGPLALRTGTFDVLALTFADVKAIRDLLDGGDIAMLRQPTHPGLDMYFLTQDVTVRMDPDTETWTATVAFEEVPRP